MKNEDKEPFQYLLFENRNKAIVEKIFRKINTININDIRNLNRNQIDEDKSSHGDHNDY